MSEMNEYMRACLGLWKEASAAAAGSYDARLQPPKRVLRHLHTRTLAEQEAEEEENVSRGARPYHTSSGSVGARAGGGDDDGAPPYASLAGLAPDESHLALLRLCQEQQQRRRQQQQQQGRSVSNNNRVGPPLYPTNRARGVVESFASLQGGSHDELWPPIEVARAVQPRP